jgi:hypothetical protein
MLKKPHSRQAMALHRYSTRVTYLSEWGPVNTAYRHSTAASNVSGLCSNWNTRPMTGWTSLLRTGGRHLATALLLVFAVIGSALRTTVNNDGQWIIICVASFKRRIQLDSLWQQRQVSIHKATRTKSMMHRALG